MMGVPSGSFAIGQFDFMKTLPVDLELVKKYNVAGPRYTSYPPATKFTSASMAP